MNNYDKGVLYNKILKGLTGFFDKNKVESNVIAGASFIKRELEKNNIFFQSGPSLEGIVLSSKTPDEALAPYVKLIAEKISTDKQQEICYNAVVAVYKAANNQTNKIVPIETLAKYLPYVDPVLNALGLFHTDEGSLYLYEKDKDRGHF